MLLNAIKAHHSGLRQTDSDEYHRTLEPQESKLNLTAD